MRICDRQMASLRTMKLDHKIARKRDHKLRTCSGMLGNNMSHGAPLKLPMLRFSCARVSNDGFNDIATSSTPIGWNDSAPHVPHARRKLSVSLLDTSGTAEHSYVHAIVLQTTVHDGAAAQRPNGDPARRPHRSSQKLMLRMGIKHVDHCECCNTHQAHPIAPTRGPRQPPMHPASRAAGARLQARATAGRVTSPTPV